MAAKRSPRRISAAEDRRLRALAESVVTSRYLLARQLGVSYGGKRDIYLALGYIKDLKFEHYWNRYDRDGLAKRIVDSPAEECWSEMPAVVETDARDTDFEKAWKELVGKHQLLQAFGAVDRLAGIGEYGVLLLGFNDPAASRPDNPVDRATELLYITPYDQARATIHQYELDAASPRYGLPLFYNLTTTIGTGDTMSRRVHHSRIIHIAEDCLSNRVFGKPRLKAVYNYLQNIETVACGSAEMFWRQARGGLGIHQPEDAPDLKEPDKKILREEIESYQHDLKTYMLLKGLEVQQLEAEVADPTNHVEVQFDLIAASTGIPKRILKGSERGELSSNQDERAYARKMQIRQRLFCEPVVLWATILRLISAGVLPTPAKPLEVQWKDKLAASAKEQADIGMVRAQAIAAVVNAIGAFDFFPLELIYKKILGLSDEEIALVEKQRQAVDRETNADLPEGDE